MKKALLSYVLGQAALLGIAYWGKVSIWVTLIPTFILIGLSAGVMCILLLIEVAFHHLDSEDSDDPFGWDKDDDDGAEDVK